MQDNFDQITHSIMLKQSKTDYYEDAVNKCIDKTIDIVVTNRRLKNIKNLASSLQSQIKLNSNQIANMETYLKILQDNYYMHLEKYEAITTDNNYFKHHEAKVLVLSKNIWNLKSEIKKASKNQNALKDLYKRICSA